jgi:hypothetical protein
MIFQKLQYLGDFMVSMLYIILHVKYGNGEDIWFEMKNELWLKMITNKNVDVSSASTLSLCLTN